MAYNSTHSGQEIDAAVEQIGSVISHVAPLTWDHIRFLNADPFPLPAKGCWFRVTTGELVYTLDGVNVQAVTAPTPEAPTAETLGSLKVFPYAEGFGTSTIAGRGGTIYKVTNLNDSGAGSLRDAVYGTGKGSRGPRTVVFEVGGVINLNSVIVIRDPNITIAGQTAPYPGIFISGYGLRPYTHDILIQHLFVRLNPTYSAGGGDGFAVVDDGADEPYNVVIDHCSVSWAYDENVSMYPNGSAVADENFTLSNCIVGEGHYGVVLGAASNVSLLRNMVISPSSRMPRIIGGVTGQIVNNVFYNPSGGFFSIIGSVDGADDLTFAGNSFIAGPDTTAGAYALADSSIQAGSEIYCPSTGDDANAVEGTGLVRSTMDSYIVGTAPVALTGITVLPVAGIEAHIAANAGARPAERDATDTRFLSELSTRDGSVKDREVQSWTQPSPTTRDIDQLLPADPDGEYNVDGWTNMDVFLYQMAKLVEGRA